ncbi:class I SAM-dependent methyltransferase [Campylobacter sp. MIT 21-1685]|uniref:class I SAM-dependent methyltransferase n=1 Tax=unclassified Campylobacter TaxID=2593542 RepID=UPI00224A5844|nr:MULTISPECIES: class I SAM-dependent methyltransferase [unclassified Campylobacter]MCX2683448.1 class I SAM-dependent methyltransferase [Campylobacter sp. MIT 21-1684]MCX2751730.1 class I SAM-dependent methyltransferase [Campylobacter sp. MIT 21-1682]MCX2807932.1 class I SAM-dependent methyltransferase [Campylobacter sp. MIT 21-1685]
MTKPNNTKNSLNIAYLGQVFTPLNIVSEMLGLIQSVKKRENPRFLEPSCGDGAFFLHLPSNKVGIEIDSNVIKDKKILQCDFFAYPISEKFDTIIGNPPYVRYQDIVEDTKFLLNPYKNLFDMRSNLYLFFIYKCILHLNEGGELIFITPRDFLKSTSSIRLNKFLFSQGTITHFYDLGDKKIFENAQPNCAIWRFEKGNFKRKTQSVKNFTCINGQILFTQKSYTIPFNELFFVKVGAVSGADSIFANDEVGNVEFVNSTTAKSGKTRKMIYGEYGKTSEYLQNFKNKLLARKIKKFSEENWWEWGRDYYKSKAPRIYVNTKTRNQKPFFLHECKAYDGSILAIFPKFEVDSKALQILCDKLNSVNWIELGFVCDGRFLFSQKSLENCPLDDDFKCYNKS